MVNTFVHSVYARPTPEQLRSLFETWAHVSLRRSRQGGRVDGPGPTRPSGLDGWVDGWRERWMDGWMGGWMDGWVGG